ncbi:hypothetical protein [Dictyobacter formicarum]|uniref:hypothetical protein n=1 Tax=Dictyobacter formicarum TaxID=2778368 RepID=UPI001916638F|nr:hypothetical protein [Dictyobacter formicarum]
MPRMVALLGGVSTVVGLALQLCPLSLLLQVHRALPPLPCCTKARRTPLLLESAQPLSSKQVALAPPSVVQLLHWLALPGSVMRCHCRDWA